MQYFIRLVIVPGFTALVVYFLFYMGFCLRPPYRETSSTLIMTLAIPYVATFFSQLHRIDAIRRIEQLERDVVALQIRLAAQ